jgi:hypothetical protein
MRRMEFARNRQKADVSSFSSLPTFVCAGATSDGDVAAVVADAFLGTYVKSYIQVAQ